MDQLFAYGSIIFTNCVRLIIIDPNVLDTGQQSITIRVKTGPCQFELSLELKSFHQSVKSIKSEAKDNKQSRESIIEAHTRIQPTCTEVN